MNLVLGLEPGTPARTADVEVDGQAFKTIAIDRHDLFNLWSGPYGELEVALRVHGHGVAAYAFTFGQVTGASASSSSSFSQLDGLARCLSKPASRARCRSSGWA